MKIKDFLDLGGNPLHNFCIGTYTDLENANRGTGRTLFYTGNDVERKDHVIVFDGTSFKALAYVEDVADNAAFKALQDDVKLLKGDVDTDAIISNMKEVSAFLAGFAEDAKLMDVLNDKLSKSQGGTISKSLTIGSPTNQDWIPIKFIRSDTEAFIGNGKNKMDVGMTDGYLQIGKDILKYVNDGTGYNIITSAGGTISGDNAEPLKINSSNEAYCGIQIKKNDVNKAWFGHGLAEDGTYIYNYASSKSIGVKDDGTPYYNDGRYNTLLHSGNIGSQSVNYANSAGVITGSEKNPNLDYTMRDNNVRLFYLAGGQGGGTEWGGGLSAISYYGGFQMQVHNHWTSNPNIFARVINEDGWSDWKQLAYLTDTVTAAYKLATARTIWGQSFDGTGDIGVNTIGTMRYLYFSDGKGSNAGYVGRGGNDSSVHLCAYGTSPIHLVTNNEIRMTINSSGNVTIGAEDKAGTTYDLYVSDKVAAYIYYFAKNTTSCGYIGLASAANNDITISTDATSKLWLNGNGNTIMNNYGGNVLIGTTEDNGAKLQVNGNISIGNTSDASICMNRGYYNRFIATKAAGAFAWQVNGVGTDVMFLDSSGRLHIGEVNSSYKLHVGGAFGVKGSATIEGDLHVKGNIIADKEVSAGGASEEGGSSSGGSGAFVSKPLNKGTNSYPINHGLETDDVIVCVYEKNTNGSVVTWDLILTDVEITDANNIKVTFGSATTVDHKVVIMGATA